MTTPGDRVPVEKDVPRRLPVYFQPAERERILGAVRLPLVVFGPDAEAWWRRVYVAGVRFTAARRRKIANDPGADRALQANAARLQVDMLARLHRSSVEDDDTPLRDAIDSTARLGEWLGRTIPVPTTRGKGRPIGSMIDRAVPFLTDSYRAGFGREPSGAVDWTAGVAKPGPFGRFVTAVASEAGPGLSMLTASQVSGAIERAAKPSAGKPNPARTKSG